MKKEMDGVYGGEISVGPWGGSSGRDTWNFRPVKDIIKQIIITHNDKLVDSIMFKADGDQYSTKYGGESGNGGTRTDKVDIDFPWECLTGISGTYERDYGTSIVIHSLRFYSNRTEYGPFGPETGDRFSFRPNGSIITGFHGTCGCYVDSIGVFIKPMAALSVSENHEIINVSKSNRSIFAKSDQKQTPRSPGPWGVNAGREFDDGVFSEIRNIFVHLQEFLNDHGHVSLCGLHLEYLKKGRTGVWSWCHGSASTNKNSMKLVKIDEEEDYSIGIEGFYGPIEGISGGIDVIRSITFHTNRTKYGPFGTEIGTYFTSMTHNNNGKVVGFFGSSGAYLNSIGLHIEYIFDD